MEKNKDSIIEEMMCRALLEVNVHTLNKMGYYAEDIKNARDYAIDHLKNNFAKNADMRIKKSA